MAFSQQVITAIREHADLVQLIGERVRLIPSGSNFKGLCPFHSEKTPSFTVSPQKGMYHCFGCGAGGSAIDFVMAYERLSFPEAVRALAGRLGIALEEREAAGEDPRGREALAAARGYYHDLLLGRPEAEPARRYLAGRGFDEDDWRAFGLGFALDDWQGLIRHAQRAGFAEADLLAAGLARRSASGRLYDLLRKRVTFPIADATRHCIAFGGRVLEPLEQPKYLNTPETAYYHKGRVLFGLAEGQEALRKERAALLVEGYLDVVRLHRSGFAQAVATCGTALTAEHLGLLARYVDKVILVFDGDEAGKKAAARTASLHATFTADDRESYAKQIRSEKGRLSKSVLDIRVVVLRDGLDPDDFVRKHGSEAFQHELERTQPVLDHLVMTTFQKHGKSLAGRDRAIQEIATILRQIPGESARDLAIRHVADLVGVRPESILRQLGPRRDAGQRAGHGAGRGGGRGDPVPDAEQPTEAAREARHERMFLRLLLHAPETLGLARQLLAPGELGDPALGALYERLLRFGEAEFAQVKGEELLELLPGSAPLLRGLMMEASVRIKAVNDAPKELVAEALLIHEQKRQHLLREIKRAEGTPAEELALRRYVKARERVLGVRACRDAGLPALAEPAPDPAPAPATA